MAEHVAVRGAITLREQNGKKKGRRKSEKKKQKSLERLGKTSWHARTKKMSQNGMLLQRKACFHV